MTEMRDEAIYITDWAKYLPSKESRPAYQYAMWRNAVFARDSYTCQHCGAHGVALNAHHIKPWFIYPAGRFDPDNGITLCRTCHAKLHHRGWKLEAELDAALS